MKLLALVSILSISSISSISALAKDEVPCNKPKPIKKIQPVKIVTRIVEKKVEVPIEIVQKIPVKTVIVNVAPQKPFVVTRIVERIVERKIPVYRVSKTTEINTRANRLFLGLGISKTDFSAKSVDCCNIETNKRHELDIGAGYMRDFSRLSVGIMGTMKLNLMLSVGVNF
jgi:hypothetical protein